MDKYFADWYARATVEVESNELALRWAAVEKLTGTCTLDQAIELVRLYRKRPTRSPAAKLAFQEAFKATDPGFLMLNNDLELSVLAGAALIHLMREDDETADGAALALVTSDCCGAGPKGAFPDATEQAKAHLEQRTASLRAMDSLDIPQMDVGPFDEQLKRTEGMNAQQIGPQIVASCKLLPPLIKSLADLSQEMATRLIIYREESNILWWVFGEHSRDLRKPMRDVGLSAASIVSGKELADLVTILPGPHAAAAFLTKVLLSVDSRLQKAIAIKDAVNSAPRDWRAETIKVSFQGIEDICPLSLALRKSLETDGTDDWVAAFEKAGSMKATKAIAPVLLSQQFYTERLLMRACGEDQSQ